jgi:2-polyprenyl-3-methyl-5-hydroxy-6-metoxy-1,4-benzoquinol methylase
MSLEEVEHCPVCNGQSFLPFLDCKDYTKSGEVFHVEQCSACGMVLTNPRPAQDAAALYYQSNQYISHKSVATSLLDSIYLIIRQFTLRWKYSLVKPYFNHKTLLDIGCGTGSFLLQCAKAGITVMGVEPSSEARTQALQHKIPVSDSLHSLPNQAVDVITLWHVLEHIYDLPRTLQLLKEHLNEHGTIFIAVPNHESADAAYYQANWAAYDVPRHVWHFSKEHMKQLLENNGLRLLKIIPMKLDAFYVCLLSEKYKTNGKLTLRGALSGIIQGYASNKKARKDMNYSSLIYIVQK